MWLYLINTDFGDWISFGGNRTYLCVVLFSSTSFFYALDVSIIVPFSNMTWSKPCDIIVLLIYKRDFTACLTLVKQQPPISFHFVCFLYTAMKSEKINKWKHLSLLRMFQILMPILYTTEIWKITQICPTCPNWRFLNLSGGKLFSREKCVLLRPDTMSGTWILLASPETRSYELQFNTHFFSMNQPHQISWHLSRGSSLLQSHNDSVSIIVRTLKKILNRKSLNSKEGKRNQVRHY